jgi:hypothetical protein
VLTQTRVLELLEYDANEGTFHWRVYRGSGARPGSLAGSIDSHGYRQIKIDGTPYLAHRLVWFVETGNWPEGELDHRDLNPANNRFHNLRAATHAQNLRNLRVRKDNVLGIKGVRRRGAMFDARITLNGKQHLIGRYESAEEASAAYAEASKRLHGEFGRSSRITSDA